MELFPATSSHPIPVLPHRSLSDRPGSGRGPGSLARDRCTVQLGHQRVPEGALPGAEGAADGAGAGRQHEVLPVDGVVQGPLGGHGVEQAPLPGLVRVAGGRSGQLALNGTKQSGKSQEDFKKTLQII